MNDFTSKIINIALICFQAVSSIKRCKKKSQSEIRDDSYRKVDTNYRTISCKSTRNDERLWLKMSHNDLQNASPSLNRNSVVVSESAKKQTRTEKDCLKTHLNNATIFKRCYIHLAKLESTWHRANTSHNHFLYDFCRIAQKMTDCCSPVDHGSRTTQSKCVRVAFVLADQSENLTTFLFAPRLSKESCDAHEECHLKWFFVFCLLYLHLSVLVYKCFVSVLIKDIFLKNADAFYI